MAEILRVITQANVTAGFRWPPAEHGDSRHCRMPCCVEGWLWAACVHRRQFSISSMDMRFQSSACDWPLVLNIMLLSDLVYSQFVPVPSQNLS